MQKTRQWILTLGYKAPLVVAIDFVDNGGFATRLPVAVSDRLPRSSKQPLMHLSRCLYAVVSSVRYPGRRSLRMKTSHSTRLHDLLNLSSCQHWFWIESNFQVTCHAVTHIMVAIRVRAIWRRVPWINYLLAIAGGAYIVATLVISNFSGIRISRRSPCSSRRCIGIILITPPLLCSDVHLEPNPQLMPRSCTLPLIISILQQR